MRVSLATKVPWLAAALVITACVEPFPPQSERSIQIGRLGVIVDQEFGAANTALRPVGQQIVYTGAWHEPMIDDVYTLFETLRWTVQSHEALLRETCASGFVSGPACGAYELAWLTTPAEDVTDYELGLWTNDAQQRIVPVWHALCSQAMAQSGNKDFCAIE